MYLIQFQSPFVLVDLIKRFVCRSQIYLHLINKNMLVLITYTVFPNYVVMLNVEVGGTYSYHWALNGPHRPNVFSRYRREEAVHKQ
jgi:hypothetical protein